MTINFTSHLHTIRSCQEETNKIKEKMLAAWHRNISFTAQQPWPYTSAGRNRGNQASLAEIGATTECELLLQCSVRSDHHQTPCFRNTTRPQRMKGMCRTSRITYGCGDRSAKKQSLCTDCRTIAQLTALEKIRSHLRQQHCVVCVRPDRRRLWSLEGTKRGVFVWRWIGIKAKPNQNKQREDEECMN